VGFFGLAVLPIGLDFGVELTYPVPESVSCGLMLSSVNAFGTVFSICCSVMIGQLDNNHLGTKASILGMTVFVVIGFILMFFVKNDLRRINLQKE